MEDRVIQQWEENAKAYAELIAGQGTPHHRAILVPALRRLIGKATGKDLLDAGCGEGYLSRLFAKEGANVNGVDISRTLIKACIEQAKKERLEIHYEIGNICNLKGFETNTFDVVLSNLVLLNVPCIDAALKEFYRVLRPCGVAVISIVHPAFNFYGPGKWKMGEKDPVTKRRKGIYFFVDRYFDELPFEQYWRTRKGDKFPRPITFYHRTISTYFKAIRNAGFLVDALEEPVPVEDDSFFERERRIPVFLVMRLQKPSEN